MVRGLKYPSELAIAHCVRGTGSIAGRCDAPTTFAVPPNFGRVDVSTTAVQRLTTVGGVYRDRLCRDSCSIAVSACPGSLGRGAVLDGDADGVGVAGHGVG